MTIEAVLPFQIQHAIFNQVIALLVSATSFEDVTFQSGLFSSGSLLGVLAGSHYNRAWIVHSGIDIQCIKLVIWFSDIRLVLGRYMQPQRFCMLNRDKCKMCCIRVIHAIAYNILYACIKP